jgi:hypothetical protein
LAFAAAGCALLACSTLLPSAPNTATPPPPPLAGEAPTLTPTLPGPTSTPAGPAIPAVAAVAAALDPDQRRLSAFVGERAAEWALPPGRYLILAVDESGQVLRLDATAADSQPLTWPADFAGAGAAPDPALAEAVHTLARFLVEAEDTRYDALAAFSGNLTVPLYTANPGQAELDRLYGRFQAFSSADEGVLAAFAAFAAQASVAASPRAAAPARGLSDIRNDLLNFFGYAGDAGLRARERILEIAPSLSGDDRTAAFDALRPDFRGDAADFNDFLARLRSGDLDTQAAQIESDLRNAPGYGAQAVLAGHSTGQLVFTEGSELVTRGAELNAAILKSVLGDVFPDITEGFDLADKAGEWGEYIESVYADPLLVGEGEARSALEELIGDRIKSDLLACCPELGETLASQIASQVGEQAVEAIPEVMAPLRASQTAIAAGTGVPPTATPLPPTVHINASMVEVVTGDWAENFDTDVVLTADFDTATVIGSLAGVSSREVIFDCFDTNNRSEVWDQATVTYGFTYGASVEGGLDTETGEFAADIAPSGDVDFELTAPFTDSRCTHLNSEPAPGIGPFSGAGTISGVISPLGDAVVVTDWETDQASVSGQWDGVGTVAPP